MLRHKSQSQYMQAPLTIFDADLDTGQEAHAQPVRSRCCFINPLNGFMIRECKARQSLFSRQSGNFRRRIASIRHNRMDM